MGKIIWIFFLTSNAVAFVDTQVQCESLKTESRHERTYTSSHHVKITNDSNRKQDYEYTFLFCINPNNCKEFKRTIRLLPYETTEKIADLKFNMSFNKPGNYRSLSITNIRGAERSYKECTGFLNVE